MAQRSGAFALDAHHSRRVGEYKCATSGEYFLHKALSSGVYGQLRAANGSVPNLWVGDGEPPVVQCALSHTDDMGHRSSSLWAGAALVVGLVASVLVLPATASTAQPIASQMFGMTTVLGQLYPANGQWLAVGLVCPEGPGACTPDLVLGGAVRQQGQWR
jgi:hypothetical protein